MQEIQAAVAAYLEKCTGIPAVAGKSKSRQYPLLAVNIQADGTTLVAGGTQAERQYTVTVTAASDREREGAVSQLSALAVFLLGGIPFGKRTLHPLNIQTEGDTLTFSLVLCTLLPQAGGTAAEWMQTVHMEL